MNVWQPLLIVPLADCYISFITVQLPRGSVSHLRWVIATAFLCFLLLQRVDLD